MLQVAFLARNAL